MEREKLFEGPLRFAPGNRVAGFFWLNEDSILALGLFPYLHKILHSQNSVRAIATLGHTAPAMRKSFIPLRDGREAPLAWFTKSQLASYREGLRDLKESGL